MSPRQVLLQVKANIEKVVTLALLLVLVALAVHLVGRARRSVYEGYGGKTAAMAERDAEKFLSERLTEKKYMAAFHMGMLVPRPRNHHRQFVLRDLFKRVSLLEYEGTKVKEEKMRGEIRELLGELDIEAAKYERYIIKNHRNRLGDLKLEGLGSELARLEEAKGDMLKLMQLKDEIERAASEDPIEVLGGGGGYRPENLALVGTIEIGDELKVFIEDTSIEPAETYILKVGDVVPRWEYTVKNVEMNESVLLEKEGDEPILLRMGE